MDDDGQALVATAGHVLRPNSEERVYAIDPETSEPKLAEILALNSTTDVAILKVPGLNGTPADLTTSARLACEPIPGFLMEMLRDGGLVPHLEKRLRAQREDASP